LSRHRNCEALIALFVRSIIQMRIALGQIMTQTFAGYRRLSLRATGALMLGATLMLSPVIFSSAASAQALGYASSPSDDVMVAPDQPANDQARGTGTKSTNVGAA